MFKKEIYFEHYLGSMFDSTIQPQYLDANGAPLVPGTLAVDLSDSDFGRIWSIQNLDNVLLCSAHNRSPTILSRGKNKNLRGFILPQAVHFNFWAWHAEFLNIGLWICLEKPHQDTKEILLTVVWDKDHVFDFRHHDRFAEADAKLLNGWLAECLEMVRKELISSTLPYDFYRYLIASNLPDEPIQQGFDYSG